MSGEYFEEPLNFDSIKEKSDKYILNTYNRAPIAFFFGQGEYLYDTENRQYIDFVSGIAVTGLGHGEADITESIRHQADRLMHTSNLYYNAEQALLAEVLVENSFPSRAFFCNSGTEANEAAFKLARAYGQSAKNGATRILSLEGSFHGRTCAGVSLSGQEKVRQGFGPLIDDISLLPANDITALEMEIERNGTDLCAFFLELIQGEGGVHPLDKDYVQAVREITKEANILLIVDEVQTGIGRTGHLFAFESYSLEPDVCTLAKGLGSGFPIGAMLASHSCAEYLGPGMHGSTFGGNHLAARTAYETLRIIMGREILKNVQSISEYILHRLNGWKGLIPKVREVRGMGLLIGIELEDDCADVVVGCREKGLLINCTAGNTIRLMPPLNIGLDRSAEALDILEGVLNSGTSSRP